MKLMILLSLGISFWMLPARPSADEIEIGPPEGPDTTAKVNPYDGDEWAPPAEVYSLSTIGHFVEYGGERLRCYTQDEYQYVLNPMFIDYRALYRAAWKWQAQVAEFEAEITARNTQLVFANNQVSFYRGEAEHWQGVAVNKSNQLEIEKKNDWIPWGIVGIESLIVGFIGVWSSVH